MWTESWPVARVNHHSFQKLLLNLERAECSDGDGEMTRRPNFQLLNCSGFPRPLLDVVFVLVKVKPALFEKWNPKSVFLLNFPFFVWIGNFKTAQKLSTSGTLASSPLGVYVLLCLSSLYSLGALEIQTDIFLIIRHILPFFNSF